MSRAALALGLTLILLACGLSAAGVADGQGSAAPAATAASDTVPSTITSPAPSTPAACHSRPPRSPRRDGLIIEEGLASTSNGMGWGSFDFTLDYDVDREPLGSLVVWAHSAQDGARIDVRGYPIRLVP